MGSQLQGGASRTASAYRPGSFLLVLMFLIMTAAVMMLSLSSRISCRVPHHGAASGPAGPFPHAREPRQRSAAPSAAEAEPQILDADLFGDVQWFSMPMFLTEGDCQLSSVLYGFAKCLTNRTTGDHHWRVIMSWHHNVPVKGNMYDQLFQFGPGNCPMPRFSLAVNTTGAAKHHFRVVNRGGFDPTALEVLVPASDAADALEYVLMIENSTYTWFLSPACPSDDAPAPELRAAKFPARNFVVLAVPPLTGPGMSYHEVLSVLHRFVYHHIRLGFDDVLIYLNTHNLHHLLKRRAFSRLLRRGRVRAVRWDITPRLKGEALTWGAQALAISHAYLAYWGQDVGLLNIDLDEWLYLPEGTKIREAWNGTCWKRWPCVKLPRLNLFCENCTRELDVWTMDGIEAPRGGGGGGVRAASSMGGDDEDGGLEEGEIDVDEYSYGGPMAHYNLVNPYENNIHQLVWQHKSYATSWAGFPAGVHQLLGCRPLHADWRCSSIVHMMNLWGRRIHTAGPKTGLRIDKRRLKMKWWIPRRVNEADKKAAAVKAQATEAAAT